MKKDLKNIIAEKAQGLTEYVLIFAFIAGVAFMMFGGNGSLKGTLVNTLSETVSILAGLFGEDDGYVTASKNYSYYFNKYKDLSSDELAGKSSEERLKADREGLAMIASLFLGETKSGVQKLMKSITNTHNDLQWVFDNLNADRMGPDENGWSQIMVPLSYWNTDIDGDFNAANGTGYSWLECSGNVNLLKQMTENAVIAGKNNDVINYRGRTATQDRIFYSDGMIGADSSDRAVAVKVHYDDGGKVDQVWIAAQTGTMPLVTRTGAAISLEQSYHETKYTDSPGNSALNGQSTSVQGLDLTVTGSKDNYKYKVN